MLVGHEGSCGGLWQRLMLMMLERLMLMMLERLMLMMLEAKGPCGSGNLPWRLVAAADADDAGAADAHDAGGRGGLWATEASMEACGSG